MTDQGPGIVRVIARIRVFGKDPRRYQYRNVISTILQLLPTSANQNNRKKKMKTTRDKVQIGQDVEDNRLLGDSSGRSHDRKIQSPDYSKIR